MLVIRLTRVGKRNQPAFRVVLTERKNPVRGKFIEILGSYNPRLKTKALKEERIKYWLSKGAQTSPTVHNLLVNEKIIEAKKVKAWQLKKRKDGQVAKSTKVPQVESETPAEEKEETKEEVKEEKKGEQKVEEKPTEEPKTE
jgi:small subunit ribosomal protein S16